MTPVPEAAPASPEREDKPAPLQLSTLGFGVAGVLASPLMSDAAVARLVGEALRLGVRYFDTAPFYGDGAGERRLAKGLAGAALGADALMSTKVGTLRRGGRIAKDFSIDGVDQSLAASAARLGREKLDLVLLHGAPPNHQREPLFQKLLDWKAQGRIAAFGWCGRGAELDPLLALGGEFLMTPVHPQISPEHAQRVARARTAGLHIIGIETLSPALQRPLIPTRPADLWRLAKQLTRARDSQSRTQDIISISACLEWAQGPHGADTALMSTSRVTHLRANAAALGLTPPGPVVLDADHGAA